MVLTRRVPLGRERGHLVKASWCQKDIDVAVPICRQAKNSLAAYHLHSHSIQASSINHHHPSNQLTSLCCIRASHNQHERHGWSRGTGGHVQVWFTQTTASAFRMRRVVINSGWGESMGVPHVVGHQYPQTTHTTLAHLAIRATQSGITPWDHPHHICTLLLVTV